MIRGIVRDVRRLLAYMRGAKGHLCAGVACFAASDFLIVWMLAMLLGDGVAAYQALDSVALITAVVSAIPNLIIALVLRGISAYCNGVATARATVAMRLELFDAVTRMPLGASHQVHSGQVLSYITNDVPAAMDALVTTLIAPVSAAIMGVFGLIYVLSVRPMMAVVALGIGAFTLVYSLLFADRLHKIAAEIQRLMAELEIRMKDLLDGMVTVRQYGMRDSMEAGMESAAGELMGEGIRWARWSGLLGGFNNATYYFTRQVLVFVAGWFVLGGGMTLPVLMKVSQMSGGIADVFHLSRLLVAVQKSLAGAERVFAFLDGCEAEDSGSERGDLAAPVAVKFDGVKFGYAGGLPVMDGISFEINAGELVALIGPSGSGKSTALRLMQGLYRPDGGRIEVLGVEVNKWNLSALRHATALVPQDPVLFTGTVAENIALGAELELDRVKECVELANAGAFVKEMGGYEATVTERGGSLSGGERQRLAIARALYRDAPVLLLDEATSMLDAIAEATVNEVLGGLKGRKTVICVTHREAVVKLADRVIVLEG